MELPALESLLTLLKKHGCIKYKNAVLELEIELASPHPEVLSTKDELIPVPEDNLPPDLKADDLFNYDKVLNWSGTPDNEPELPLTGDL